MNSCKKTKNKIILLAVVPLFLTLGGIILRMINLISFYDSAIGYYEKAALPIVMNIFFIVSIIVFASVCFFSEKKNIISESFANTSFFKVVCVICSIAMAVCALNCFSDNSKALLAILVPIASVCSVIFFVLFLLKKQPDYSAIFALFPVALCAMILAVTYFDVKVEMNSPNKMLIHFACIASMLAFVSEARLLADNKKERHISFSLPALFSLRAFPQFLP